jgi:hypothetical protein
LYRLHHLGLTETLAIVAQTAAGLGYANRMGVIHRDIKPSNLMLTDGGQVKIMDFGIARIRGTQRLTKSGLLGTYAYLAPEQFRGGEGTERSDLYALACVTYEMLSGNIPFDAPTEAEMMRGHLEMPPRPLREMLPNLNPQVDAAIQRALSKDPNDRFANVEEFSDALGAGSIERQAQEIVRSSVLSRMPPPSRPTTLSDLQPSLTPPGFMPPSFTPSGGSGAISGGVILGPVDRSALARRMPAIALGGAATGIVVVALAIVFQDRLIQEPPLPVHVVGPTNVRPLSADTIVPPLNGNKMPERPVALSGTGVPRPGPGDFVAPAKPPGESIFLRQDPPRMSEAPKESADALMAEAQRLAAKGDISNARVNYLRAATAEPRAYVELAHLYDPTQPGRSNAADADPRMAALYYQDAEKMNDRSALADRERLRRFLQDLADHKNDYDARAMLGKYWP